MVPIAGDEITDKICKELLIDYHTGETNKGFFQKVRKIQLTIVIF
ncbi:hypothetical protein [Natranaerobius trueperi]|nr:hypothetical protein [Natranaerobius trueperi]